MPAVFLENLTWLEADAVLRPDTIVLIPLGASLKEHGPHLRLNNDATIAEKLTARVAEVCQGQVAIASPVTYHFYPAFVDYPGSVSLRLETARDLIIDICRSLHAFGPRFFYVLNTGISTVRPLKLAAESLRESGITMHFTDLKVAMHEVEEELSEQEGGSHADEMETSLMLFIAADRVDMSKAGKDYDADAASGAPGPLRRHKPEPGESGAHSPSGIWGDATLATYEKGRAIEAKLIEHIKKDLDKLARCARIDGD